MNIQRFIAATSREAMSKARNAFGDSAVILSSRATDEGFEVMAAAEESLAPMAPQASLMPRNDRIAPIVTRRSGSRPGRPPQFDDDEDDSVEADTEALAMSTLSFQDYVRERMLRKRRGESVDEPTLAAPAQRAAAKPAPRWLHRRPPRGPRCRRPPQRPNGTSRRAWPASGGATAHPDPCCCPPAWEASAAASSPASPHRAAPAPTWRWSCPRSKT